jgi:hypothetical protein
MLLKSLLEFVYQSIVYDVTCLKVFFILNSFFKIKRVSDAFSNEQAIFRPHYSIIDGSCFGCDVATTSDTCNSLCTNNGRYCTVHAKNLSGHGILQETVRRLCIAELYWSNETGSEMYWTYIIQHCISLVRIMMYNDYIFQ